MVSDTLNIVILAGGAGTRLWPMSTKQKPKQFQKLISDKTMLQETYERALLICRNIYVSTNNEYASLVKEQLPNLPADNLILEPSLQDTGPCIGLAAAVIAKKDPHAVMAVIYADHLVKYPEELKQKIEVAAQLAMKESTLNIIEVNAKSPNTNLGYVKIGNQIKEIDGVDIYELEKFIEKPDQETANRFLEDFHYLWNTGFYVWTTEAILKEFAKHLPKTYSVLKEIMNGGNIDELYPSCDKISIDYGIMEKIDPSQVRIIPADLGWSDIGTWASLHEELAEKREANVIKGEHVIEDSTGNLIYNETDNKVAVFGVNDLIIVQVKGKTLICPKDRSADLKQLINKLNESN